MTEPTKCPCCGAAVDDSRSESGSEIVGFACGSYSYRGTPPVRGNGCLDNELAALRRFKRDVQSVLGDSMLQPFEQMNMILGLLRDAR